MNIKNIFTILLLVLIVALCAPAPASAQTPMPWTQLNAAILDSRTTSILVTSLTSSGASSLVMAAPTNQPGSQMMLVVDGEAMQVVGVNSTTVTVTRGYNRTTATSHANSHVVWFGPTNYFHTNAPGGGVGAVCTQAGNILPYVTINQDSKRAELWDCATADDTWVQQQMTEQAPKTFTRYCTTPLPSFTLLNTGSGAVYNYGNSTTPVSGTIFYGTIEVPRTMLVTGLSLLNGTAAGTDKYVLSVSKSDGTLIATTPVAGTTSVGASLFQDIAFSTSYILTGPARYWIGAQANGTTTRIATVPVEGAAGTAAFTGLLGSSVTGTFGTIPNLSTAGSPASTSMPTSLIANTAPIACVY